MTKEINSSKTTVSTEQAQKAIETILEWMGEDPKRDGLLGTPKRVINSYEKFFQGYKINIEEILNTTFENPENYNDIVLVKNISFNSHCEHHMIPITGTAHIGYLPSTKIVGISKMVRLVYAFAERLQTQETMTMQIAKAIEKYLKPKGIAVIIDADHGCMSLRGVKNKGASTVTQTFLGCYQDNSLEQQKIYNLIQMNNSSLIG